MNKNELLNIQDTYQDFIVRNAHQIDAEAKAGIGVAQMVIEAINSVYNGKKEMSYLFVCILEYKRAKGIRS